MDVLYLIISIVVAVLYIILFFKVWGMTNDIRAMKKENDNVLKAKIAYLKGDQVKAKELLDNAFYSTALALLKDVGEYGYEYPNIVAEFSKLYEKMNLEKPDFEKLENWKDLP